MWRAKVGPGVASGEWYFSPFDEERGSHCFNSLARIAALILAEIRFAALTTMSDLFVIPEGVLSEETVLRRTGQFANLAEWRDLRRCPQLLSGDSEAPGLSFVGFGSLDTGGWRGAWRVAQRYR